MLRNYNSFTLLLESKKRDKKLDKQRQKIHKFLSFDPIIDFVFDRVVDSDSTKGLQYTVWFSNILKKYFIDELIDSDFMKNMSIKIDDKRIAELKEDEIRKILNDVLTGKETSKLSKKIWLKTALKHKWQEFVDGRTQWKYHSNTVNHIRDWLKSPIREEEEVDLNQYDTLKKAADRATEWHENIEATGVVINEEGTVLITFDDGYYWIDLETNSCEDEANAMGHCGTTDYGDTLYSLRRKQSPHVTSAIGNDGTVYQMKGRNNKKPTEKYHPYILELLKYPNNGDHVKVINDFEEISNFSTDEYLAEEDFHIFDLTGEQIKELAEANKPLIESEGIGVKYKLMKDGHISKEDLIKDYDDLRVVNDKIHFVVDGWDSFSQDIFKENRDYRTGWQFEVIEGTYRENLWYDTMEFDYTYSWDKLEPRVFKELYNHCTHQGYKIEYYDEEKEEDIEFMMSTENTSISPKEDDLWIKTPIGGVLSFESLLSTRNGSTNIKTDQGQTDFSGSDWSELQDTFDQAYTQAQEGADESEAYNTVTGAIEDKVGKLIKNSEKNYWWYEENNKGEKKGYLHFDLDLEWISELDAALSDNYSSIIDIINDIPNMDTYDNNYLIDCDPPYYGWSGTIDGETLSEEIINKLYDL